MHPLSNFKLYFGKVEGFQISFPQKTVFSDIVTENQFWALFRQNTVILDLTLSEKLFKGFFQSVWMNMWHPDQLDIESVV